MYKSLLILLIALALEVSSARAADPRTITLTQPATQPAATVASATVAPTDFATALDDQLNRLLRGQPTLAEPELSALTPEDRELTASVLETLATVRSSARSATTLAEKTRPLLELSERIKQR